MRRLPIFLYGLSFYVAACGVVLADDLVIGTNPTAADSKTPASPNASTALGAEAWAEIIRAAVVSTVPEKNVQSQRWGHTTEVFSRYEIKTRKGRLSMRPRTKEVNHGFWQRQTVTLLNPAETLRIDFQNIQHLPDGRLKFSMRIVLRARITTEFEHWVYGVKGLNGEVEADVTFAAVADCSFDLKTVQQKGELLPSLQIVPEVTDLRLKVSDIDARKIGLIGGWAAEEIGDSSRSTVNSVLHEYEGAILKDLRKKIEKNRDRLKISPTKLLGGATPSKS